MNKILALTTGALLFSLAGCGRPQGGAPSGQASDVPVSIKGSDTMVHLVTSWAEDYMAGQPAADISVTGGGSGTGIAALLNGNTDICAASREMTAEERQVAAQKNLVVKEIPVARDGIAVIVHPSNPVSELTMSQLKGIYTGGITSWAQVGGPAGNILLLSRESSSGTYVFFQEHVLQKADFAPGARLMPATSTIIQAVGDDALAIGYVGLGYAREAAEKVKVVAVKADENAPAVVPSEETVRNGSYSISRPLYFYVTDPVPQAAQRFIDFCLGAHGQEIVKEIGYVTVN